jgi:uncharacterized protein
MHAPLPERIDIDRAVAAGRLYEGVVPLARFERLGGNLVDTQGDVEYVLQFQQNELNQSTVVVSAHARLPLLCQTTLERYEHPVSVYTRLGFVVREDEEAGLPEGFEAVLKADGWVDPVALIEDELILAVPLIPRRPGSEEALAQHAIPEEPESAKPNPFAALQGLKRTK